MKQGRRRDFEDAGLRHLRAESSDEAPPYSCGSEARQAVVWNRTVCALAREISTSWNNMSNFCCRCPYNQNYCASCCAQQSCWPPNPVSCVFNIRACIPCSRPAEVVANPYAVKLVSGCKCSEMDASHRPRNLPANLPEGFSPRIDQFSYHSNF